MSVCSITEDNFTCKFVTNLSSLLDHSLYEWIPVLQPSRFYSCPFEHDNSSCEEFMYGKSLLSFCLQNLLLISMKNLTILSYVVEVLPRKFMFISENFYLDSQRK